MHRDHFTPGKSAMRDKDRQTEQTGKQLQLLLNQHRKRTAIAEMQYLPLK